MVTSTHMHVKPHPTPYKSTDTKQKVPESGKQIVSVSSVSYSPTSNLYLGLPPPKEYLTLVLLVWSGGGGTERRRKLEQNNYPRHPTHTHAHTYTYTHTPTPTPLFTISAA